MPFFVLEGRLARTWIALLAGIGGATHKAMSMSHLRDACEKSGLVHVRTVLATGNIIFESDLSEAGIMKLLCGIVADHGLDNAVFLRRPAQLRAARKANPFPDAADERPNHLLVHFLASKGNPTALEDYQGPERISVQGREVYIDYAEGIGRSRLTSARLLRALGQPGTARNWNTLEKLIDKAADQGCGQGVRGTAISPSMRAVSSDSTALSGPSCRCNACTAARVALSISPVIAPA